MREEVNFKLEGKEWVELQNKAFEKLNKKANIDGFRPGKAPRNIYEQKYGKQCRAEHKQQKTNNAI